MSRSGRSRSIWEKIRGTPARIPKRVAIDHDHVSYSDPNESDRYKLREPFKTDEHYFQVKVNELYLRQVREWLDTYDPMVLVVSEFTYISELAHRGKEEVVPFVVGPMVVEKRVGMKMPAGMVLSDTRVAGLHPYRGGRLALTLVLCRVKRESYARKMLQIVEGAANILDFSTQVSAYLKVADIVLDGVEALLGSQDTQPLIGSRREFDPAKQGFFALINKTESEIDKDELWVHDRQLLQGRSLVDAQPFREADYVLYNILQTQGRDDVSTLPFYPKWVQVQKEALGNTKRHMKSALSKMSSLHADLMLSPDLTNTHADKLSRDWEAEMRSMHKRAVVLAHRGPKKKKLSELDKIRKRSLEILEMET